MTADNDINAMFEKHTIKEIEDILFKMRNDIERKKEDLRIMVGERYRDLIEAADTISDMRESADAVCKNIQTMEGLCESLQQRGLIGFKTRRPLAADNSRLQSNTYQYSLANQVKLLVDVPEFLWGLTEKKEYLDAAKLLLLSQQAHTALQLSPNATEMLEKFPVISRQWSNISQFRSTITTGCVALIKSEIKDCEMVMKATAAMALLDGTDPKQSLKKVLDLRKGSLASILLVRPSTTAKRELVSYVVFLISSFRIIRHVFSAQKGDLSPLEKKIRAITGEQQNDGDSPEPPPISLLHESSLGLHFLPKSVLEFRPKVRWRTEPLDQAVLLGETRLWLDSVMSEASGAISKLLSYTTSIKALSIIRESIWDSQTAEAKENDWNEMVMSTLGEKFSPWDSIIRHVSLQKAQALVRKELEGTKNTILLMVKTLATEITTNQKMCDEEGDISDFIWSESSSDLPDQVAWSVFTTRNASTSGEKMGLFYKSRGYTKNIQAICRSLNNRLSVILEDMGNYSAESIEKAIGEVNPEKEGAVEDYNTLLQYLETESSSVFTGFLKDVEAIASEHFKPLENSSVSSAEETKVEFPNPEGTVVVMLSRFTQAVPVVCQHLKICAAASLLGNPDTARRVSLGLQPETKSWLEVKQNFSETSSLLLSRFLSLLVRVNGARLKDELNLSVAKGEAEDVLRLFPLWEKVLIKEEGETGAVVESSICIPAHPSPALSKVLSSVCSAMNALCAHTVSRPSQTRLVTSLCSEIASVYESLDATQLNQTTALQLLFDLKLLQILLLPRESKVLAGRISKLVQNLESRVDPFDLDVFAPHLSARVKATSQRLLVLLGTVIPREKQPLTVRGVTSSSSNNTLIIVPSVEIPRFSNVPLPASTLTRTTSMLLSDAFGSHMKETETTRPLDTSASQPSVSTLTTSRSAASSLFSAMSSSWFGGTS